MQQRVSVNAHGGSSGVTLVSGLRLEDNGLGLQLHCAQQEPELRVAEFKRVECMSVRAHPGVGVG